MLTELKPCPFCGMQPEEPDVGDYFVECPRCGVQGPITNKDGRPHAKAEWNRRAIEAEALQAQEPIGYVGRHIAHAIQGGSAGLTTITQHQAFDDDVALYTAPQPPASCPKRIELEPVAYSWVSPSLERTMLGDKPPAAWIGARDIYTLVRQSDASAIIAGKDVEIKTLRVENDALAKSAAAAGNKCDALQAKVAELEKVAKAYEDQVAAHNKTLNEIARLSSMIEMARPLAEEILEIALPGEEEYGIAERFLAASQKGGAK